MFRLFQPSQLYVHGRAGQLWIGGSAGSAPSVLRPLIYSRTLHSRTACTRTLYPPFVAPRPRILAARRPEVWNGRPNNPLLATQSRAYSSGEEKGFWETFKDRLREGFNTKEGRKLQEELERKKKNLEDLARSDVVKRVQEGAEAAQKDITKKASSYAETAKKKGVEKAEEFAKRVDKFSDDVEKSEAFKKAKESVTWARAGVDRSVNAMTGKLDNAADALGTHSESLRKRVEQTSVYKATSKLYMDTYSKVQEKAPYLLPPSQEQSSTGEKGSSALVVTSNQPKVWDVVKSSFAKTRVGKRVADIKQSLEESDNPIVQRSIDMGFRLKRLGGQLLRPSEYGQAMAAVQKRRGGFDEVSFVHSLEERVLPELMQAINDQDQTHIDKWVKEKSPFANILKHQFDNLKERGLTNDTQVLHLSDVELHTGALTEDGDPTFIVSWKAQVRLCVRDDTGNVVEGAEDNVTAVNYVASIVNDAEDDEWKFAELEELSAYESF